MLNQGPKTTTNKGTNNTHAHTHKRLDHFLRNTLFIDKNDVKIGEKQTHTRKLN